MKKFVIFIMLLLTLILLVGCDPATYYFKKTEYIDKIQRIELVKYTNEEYKIVDCTKEALRFDFQKAIAIEILNEDKFADFLEEFETIVFHQVNESVNEPTGYCLLWYLRNGSCIVFSCTMVEGDRAYDMAAEFALDGTFIRHHAHFASRPHYENILEKYFEDY